MFLSCFFCIFHSSIKVFFNYLFKNIYFYIQLISLTAQVNSFLAQHEFKKYNIILI